jgi:hypothetical protein
VLRALSGLLAFTFCLTLSAAEAPRSADSAIQPVLERFLARSDEPLTAYRAIRRLEGANDRFDKHAVVEVVTELRPGGQFHFEIISETGSEYVRDKVLRPILETEAKVFSSGKASQSALTPENYELGGGVILDEGLVKLFAKPRRKDVSLIDGAVFLTSDDADLVRIEGRMAKNPSFWTTRVNVVRHYDRIAGIRVPVRLDSTAQIRFAGESTLTMSYDYQSINGVDVR